MKRWAPWAKAIGAGVTDADLKIALRVMRKVRGNLDVEKSNSKGSVS
jgi:hypothetical protein